jgi:hypothetical protein
LPGKRKSIYPPVSNISKSVSGAVTTMQLDNVSAGWEQWFLFMADAHFDSPSCARDVLDRHLKEARQKCARIMIFGDWFDAMQGRFDPRRSMDELRPEYRSENYYDLLVKYSAEYLKEYADLIDVFADGNHELSTLKNANTNPLDNLLYRLRTDTGANIIHGGYGGWVKFILALCDSTTISINLKYFHGAGAEAPVTRGVIQTNRQAVYLPDADIVVNGHNHNSYWVPIARERISQRGKQYIDIQHHVRTPGYKNEYGDGSTGWAVTKGMVPKPIGAVWLRMWFDAAGTERNHNGQVRLQFIPDVCGAEAVRIEGASYGGRVYNDDAEGA